MASLSEELLRLSELFACGTLTEEEFKAAKEVTIKQYTSTRFSPAIATAPSRSEEVRRDLEEGAEAHVSFSQIDISGFGDDIAGLSQREEAYNVLETIVRNLQLFPNEQKYRQLRLGNPTLQSRLFSVSGVMEFLKSMGFVVVEDCGGDGGWVQLPNAPRRAVLDEALNAICHLRRRDQDVQSRTRDYMRLRRNFTLDMRREKCEKARVVGELRSYIVQEFCLDDAGDGFYSSLSSLEKLGTILTNVLRFPAEAKYRKLRLSNRTVHAAVLQQRGGLELVLECAGGEVVEEAGEAFLLLREGAATEGKLRGALQVVEEARAAVQEAREKMNQQAHEEAQKAMRIETRRARAEEMRRLGLQRGAGAPAEGLSHQNGEGERPQRRVPVAEAVRILLGKKGCEEDEDR